MTFYKSAKLAQQLFFFVLVFSPLSFGARAPWSFGIVSAAVFSGFLVLLIHKKSENKPLYRVPGSLPLFLFCLWILIQIVPLPPWLVKLISGNTYALYQNTSGIIHPNAWISISVNKHDTLMTFFRHTTYAVFYVFMVQSAADIRFLKKTVNIITGLAAVIAAFAVIQYVVSEDMIYGLRSVPRNATPFGPYIYHNHFAGFMEMVFPVIVCLFLYYKPNLSSASLRQRLYEFFVHPGTNPHLLYGLCAVLTGVSVFVSYSRGGIISLCVSMMFMAAVMIGMTVRRKEGMFLFFLIIIIILFSVGWFGWDVIFERFEKIRNADGFIQDSRLPVWQDTIRIIKDYPLTGTGMGTFLHIYPGYRTLEGDLIFDHAHNDYLEFLAGGGITGALLCVWFLVSVFAETVKRVRKRRDSQAVFLYLGSITGIIAIMIHSITDFNMQNGANGLYFFLLAGLSVSAAHTRRKAIHSDTFLPQWRSRITGAVIPVTAFFLMLTCGMYLTCVMGQYHFYQIQSTSLDENLTRGNLEKIAEKVRKAGAFDPLNAQYHYGIGNTSLALMNFEQAKEHFKYAVQLNPVKGEYLQRLGFILSGDENRTIAVKLIEAGIQMDIGNPDRYRDYAGWLAQNNEIPRSIVAFRQCMALSPSRENMNQCIAFMKIYGLNESDIYRSIPRQSRIYLYYGDYLADSDAPDKTAEIYDKALALVKREDTPVPWYFLKISGFYRKNGRPDKALKVMQQGIAMFPDNVHIRLRAGDLYKQNGIIYRAIEEYRNALIIESENAYAKKRLAELM